MSLWSRVQRRLGDLAGELVLDEYRDQLDQAQRLLAGGDPASAIEVLEALLFAKPDHGQALIVLGEARLVALDPAGALTSFEQALKLRPGDPAALVGHGLTLVTLARYEPAIGSLARAVTEAAGDRAILADAYRGLGVAWRRRGDVDKAIRELRKAVAEDGDDADARAALGEALVLDGGPYDEALRHLERASKGDEPPALALYALGRMSLVEGDTAIAGEQLARARAAAERDATPLGAQLRLDVIIAQGDAALAERDAPRAHGFFLEALQVEPRRADLHAKIAATHRSIGNLDAALASFERALALGAGVDTLRAAVDAAIAAGDPLRQARWASDLLTLDPADVRAIVARGAAMADSQPEAARALLELAAARDDVDAHVGIARLALTSDPAAAAASALAALRVAPHHAAARQLLTEARASQLGAPGPEIADLADFIQRLVGQRRELGHLVADVARAAANLDQPLLVTVMGEFSSGKSSFVNAFIGADVAPTGITPTTATINVVRYGRERGGRILGADGTTLELGWDALMAHLRALTPAAARGIDRVEILVPLPQLEKINIVDTPGLNSIQPEHEATARAFIARADAVVWVFTAAQGGKASEKRALASIRDEGKRVLGVLNKADQLGAGETDEVVGFIAGELGDLVEAVVPFAARPALAWKKAGARATDARSPGTATDARSPGTATDARAPGTAIDARSTSTATDARSLGTATDARAPGTAAAGSSSTAADSAAPAALDPRGLAPAPSTAADAGAPSTPPSHSTPAALDARSPGTAPAAPPAPQPRPAATLAPRSPGTAADPGARSTPPSAGDAAGQRGPKPAGAATGRSAPTPASAAGATTDPVEPGQRADGNWAALEAALEQRFFQQARQLKRDGCARVLRSVASEARGTIAALQTAARAAADDARRGRDELFRAAHELATVGVLVERKALSEATSLLYRRAAREVLDLVRPRRLPFSSHSATAADRDYLIALLSSGFDAAIEGGRRRVAVELATRARLADTAARTLSSALGVDVVGDLQRAADDRIGLALSRVFDRARAFLRGYLEGGYVEAFFKNDVPRLELAEDAVYHALVRGSPDLDRELGEPLARAATDALTALARRLEHWGAVLDVHAFDLEVGIGRALELAEARL